jgi:type I restriction enzyme S subunit
VSLLTLVDICEVTAGQSAPQDTSAFGKEGTPFIRAGSLERLIKGHHEDSFEKISDDKSEYYRLRLFPRNTIIFAKSGMSAKLGRVHRLRVPTYVVSHLAAIIPGTKVDPRYLQRWFEKNPPSRLIPNESYPSTRISEISKLTINLPPLPEQKRIAEILDKSDGIRRKREEALQLADSFLRATFLDMFGDPVTNPKEWERKGLNDVGILRRGKSKHRPRNAPDLLGGPYPLIQTGDIANSHHFVTQYKQTYSELGLKQSMLWPKKTLCITIAANIGDTAILTFDACFPDSIVGFIPNGSVKTEYIHMWLTFYQNIIREKAPESAQKNINLKILSELKIPIPPISRQKKFVYCFKQVELLKVKMRDKEKDLEDCFNSLTQRAFRGEL